MSKKKRKIDFKRLANTDLNEEAKASSFKRGMNLDLGKVAEDLYKAVDEDDTDICEDDIPTSRKRLDNALDEVFENDERFCESGEEVCEDDIPTSRKRSDNALDEVFENDERFCEIEDEACNKDIITSRECSDNTVYETSANKESVRKNDSENAKTVSTSDSAIEKSKFARYCNQDATKFYQAGATVGQNTSKDDIAKKASEVLPIPKAKVKEKDLSLDDIENAILQKIAIVRHDGGIYYHNGRSYIAIKCDADLLEIIRSANISASCFQIKSVKIFGDLYMYMNSDPKLIPCEYEKRLHKCKNYVVLNNGVLDVKHMVLKPFDKEYLTFSSVKASYVENPNPKRFLKVLYESAGGDKEIVRLTSEVIGVLLSSLNLKRYYVIGTARDSGKSTLAMLLKRLIGDDFVVAIPPNNLGDRFALGATRGKTLNLAMDIPNGKLNSTAVSRLKNITGSDAITIEQKYMRPESTVSTLRFLFGTNYPITLPREDDDDAFWERMVVIPFLHSIPPEKVNRNLLEELMLEKDDIVSFCLQQLHKVIRNNYTHSYCSRGEEMKQSWRRSEFSTASMAYFWNNRIEETGNPEDAVYASALYGAYINYCADNGLDAVSYIQMVEWISKSVDPESCQKKRIHRTGTNPLAGYVGIKLKSN